MNYCHKLLIYFIFRYNIENIVNLNFCKIYIFSENEPVKDKIKKKKKQGVKEPKLFYKKKIPKKHKNMKDMKKIYSKQKEKKFHFRSKSKKLKIKKKKQGSVPKDNLKSKDFRNRFNEYDLEDSTIYAKIKRKKKLHSRKLSLKNKKDISKRFDKKTKLFNDEQGRISPINKKFLQFV